MTKMIGINLPGHKATIINIVKVYKNKPLHEKVNTVCNMCQRTNVLILL